MPFLRSAKITANVFEPCPGPGGTVGSFGVGAVLARRGSLICAARTVPKGFYGIMRRYLKLMCKVTKLNDLEKLRSNFSPLSLGGVAGVSPAEGVAEDRRRRAGAWGRLPPLLFFGIFTIVNLYVKLGFMKYYLDTVSARKMSKYFDKKFIKENCFVSIQVLSELLTDLDEKNFPIKKNTLNKIIENNIFIDWEPPHKKQYESFGFYNITYNLKKDDVLLFYDNIKNANDLNEFYKNIEKHNEEYDKLKNYDKAFENYFRKEMSLKIQDFSNEFTYGQATNISENVIEYVKKTDVGLENFRIAMCMKMAEDLCNGEMNKYEQRTLEAIVSSYNGQIDVFLIISGIYALTKVPRKEQIARNDFNDLYHLIYVDSEKIIISDDGIFTKYMKDIFPRKNISCKEYISGFFNP